MGSTPKRKVVGSTPIWDAIFKRFNRIFNGFWRVNDKRDLSDVFIIQISFCFVISEEWEIFSYQVNFFVWILVEKLGGYFFLFFLIALIVQAKPVIIESSIAPLIASFIPAPKKKTNQRYNYHKNDWNHCFS